MTQRNSKVLYILESLLRLPSMVRSLRLCLVWYVIEESTQCILPQDFNQSVTHYTTRLSFSISHNRMSPSVSAGGTVAGSMSHTLFTQIMAVLTHTVLWYVVSRVTAMMTGEPGEMGRRGGVKDRWIVRWGMKEEWKGNAKEKRRMGWKVAG